ncbi:DciA family protein [Kitasatospora sp. NPDC058478]|uniref:DciA family protein n=1 Tax=unclassified Kitasatospora TaxID=2633591 RepID=UPI00365BE86D
MSNPPSTGADLARQALARARENAQNKPNEASQTKRRTRVKTRASWDRRPVTAGGALAALLQQAGWDLNLGGADIITDWPAIAPELSSAVAAERYDPGTGTLHLRPTSPAYATQLRLHATQIAARINEKTGGRPPVRSLSILAPGPVRQSFHREPEVSDPPASPPEPVEARSYIRDDIAQELQHLFEAGPERRAAEQAAREKIEADSRRLAHRHCPSLVEPEPNPEPAYCEPTAEEHRRAESARRQLAAEQRLRHDRTAAKAKNAAPH